MSRNVYEVQRDFALSSGLRSEIMWDSLSPEQEDILQKKIQTLLPDIGNNPNMLQKMRKDLFENIWSQRKYTNRTLLSAIIYVLVTPELKADVAAQQSTIFSCHPVFRTRKCIRETNSAGCCMIFIDEHARVYGNWSQYLKNNVLPAGTMVAPANGVYTFSDITDEVNLEYHLSPAARTPQKVLNTTDTVAGVGGLVATVPIAAALALPVAAPIMAAATVVAVSTAAYSTVRSAMQLKDRYKHGQSTALTDRQARNSWLGVAGGVVGLGASGATKALTMASTAGKEISVASKLAVNGINVSSILLSGTGLANSVYDLYIKVNDADKISAYDVLQLGSSLLVFTHSINNLRIASNVVTQKRGFKLQQELRSQISSLFDKVSCQTKKLPGFSSSAKKFDIIRTVNDVPLKKALMSLHKINEHLNSHGAGTALKIFTSTILPKIVIKFNDTTAELDFHHLVEEFGTKLVYHIINPSSFLDVLSAMATYFCERVFHFLMRIARTFIEENVDAIDRMLNTFVSTETVLYKILMHCVTNYKNFSYEFLESKTGEILHEIEKYFNSLNPNYYENVPHDCPTCKGYYYICSV